MAKTVKSLPQIILQTYSYRFAEQVLNSRLSVKQEIESMLTDSSLPLRELSRPQFNKELEDRFLENGWDTQPLVFGKSDGEPLAKMDFLKDRVGIEVGFGHSSFIGIDLLKMQLSSFSGLDRIDVGIYIVTTSHFQKRMKVEFGLNWSGSLSFEKVCRYLPHFRSAIHVPVFAIGIDLP